MLKNIAFNNTPKDLSAAKMADSMLLADKMYGLTGWTACLGLFPALPDGIWYMLVYGICWLLSKRQW